MNATGSTSTPFSLMDRLRQCAPSSDKYAVQVVQLLLDYAREIHASDIHFIPNANQRLDVLCRVDGLLQSVAVVELMPQNIVSRLKVLAELLTYRTDIPQEGRIRQGAGQIEMRVSTFPTVHGEKAVVRLFIGSGTYLKLEDLGYPTDVHSQLSNWLIQPQGALLVTGPAGAGKTTTLYAALRKIQQLCQTPRSVCTLEDPVEALVPGVAQSQIQPQAGFTYDVGLKSLLRQDPEVLMVGEIRDPVTASTVFQAALTGHQVLSTFHAGRAAEACGRLLDMGIEPYVLKSGLLGVLAQRLVRRLCECSQLVAESESKPAGCERCHLAGYWGRLPLAEVLGCQQAVGMAILKRADVQQIEYAAIEDGMIPLRERARVAVEQRLTSSQEILRVLGLGPVSVETP